MEHNGDVVPKSGEISLTNCVGYDKLQFHERFVDGRTRSTTHLQISTCSTHLSRWVLTYLQISTCSMHLFRYVLPSVPHTGSLSFPHRCSHCDPDERMQSPGSDASRTPAKIQAAKEDVTIK